MLRILRDLAGLRWKSSGCEEGRQSEHSRKRRGMYRRMVQRAVPFQALVRVVIEILERDEIWSKQ